VYIGFVEPDKPMIRRYVKNISLKIRHDAPVIVEWIGKDGVKRNIEVSRTALTGPSIAKLPEDAYGIAIRTKDSDCDFCYFGVTDLSFDTTSDDSLCSPSPMKDARLSHQRLVNEKYDQFIYNILDSYKRLTILPVKFQTLLPAKTTYPDEYAIIVKMPSDGSLSEQDIFADMRYKLDTVGRGLDRTQFKTLGSFIFLEGYKISKRPNKTPIIGDTYIVDIIGIDNGDVMITDIHTSIYKSYFRYSTLETKFLPQNRGSHPNNGSREYGYETALDKTIKFYVRGIDQFRVESAALVGRKLQDLFWLNLLEGIGARVKNAGGEIVHPASKTIDELLPNRPPCHQDPPAKYKATLSPR
jgi:hypothetical protein